MCWTVVESVPVDTMQSQRAKKCKLWSPGVDSVDVDDGSCPPPPPPPAPTTPRHSSALCSPLQPFFHQVINQFVFFFPLDCNVINDAMMLQVGGHTQFLQLDEWTVCKPLIPRELSFYLNAPPEIQNFIPHYKGIHL